MLKWTVRALLILALVQLAAPLLAAPAGYVCLNLVR